MMIRILYKQPGRHIRTLMVKDSLQSFQNLVGGRIEVIGLFRDVVMICNEEGKIRDLPKNFAYGFDTICGPVVFASTSGEDLNSLTREQMEKIRDIVEEGEKYV